MILHKFVYSHKFTFFYISEIVKYNRESTEKINSEVIKSGKFSVKKICEAVGIEQQILRDGLKREGLTFKDFKKLD